jgi:hypothetical protein
VRTYGNPSLLLSPPTEVHRDDTVKNEIVTVINDPRASLVIGSEQGWLSRINGLTLGMRA